MFFFQKSFHCNLFHNLSQDELSDRSSVKILSRSKGGDKNMKENSSISGQRIHDIESALWRKST